MENSKKTSSEAAQQSEALKTQITSLIEKIDTWENIHSNSYYIETLQSTVPGVHDESELYELTNQYPALASDVLKVLDSLISANDYKRNNSLWVNERCRAGKTLAECFALTDKSNIPTLIDFIQSYDARLDDTVVRIWDRWGFCQEICELIVIYIMQAENGAEVIAQLNDKELPISEIMKNEKNADMFLQHIWDWLKSDMAGQGYDLDDLELTLRPVFQTVFSLTEEESENAAALVVDWYESDEDVAAPTYSQIIASSI